MTAATRKRIEMIPRKIKPPNSQDDELTNRLKSILVGQDGAIDKIVPYIQAHKAGLSPAGRPVGIVLLLGPTGTGKTRTAEALAQVLFGNWNALVKIDCAEFQHSHEIAKLTGSPPGYLGHRETHPALSQAILNKCHTETLKLSLLLFDEIEKSSDALWNLLLGITDKALLTLGDNTRVNFEQTLIFLTSNLGASQIQNAIRPRFGLGGQTAPAGTPNLAKIGLAAAKSKFTPEFMNRIDEVITYRTLGREECEIILYQILAEFEQLVVTRLGQRAFTVSCTKAGRELLLDKGTSSEYGARELKRTIQRNFIQPVSALVARGEVPSGSSVILDAKGDEFQILIRQ